MAAPGLTRRPQDGQPEALRGLDPQQHDHLRDRPGGHRQDLPRRGDGRRRAVAPRGQPHHPHAPRRGGGRAPRLPAGGPDGQGRPLPAPPVRRAARHARPREGLPAPRARRDRDRAAGVHARAHAQRLLRDPRRGAEHDARADEDVPHAPGLRLEGWSSPGTSPRSTCRASSAPGWWRWRTCSTRSRTSRSCAWAARTWCATSSCSGSSRPTASTPSDSRRSCAPPSAPTAAARRRRLAACSKSR